MSTPYHAKYFAHELSRNGGQGVDRLSRSLFDACVDLNPHQIEAALFALRSPISKGVVLADEVGLGKTIEAGLVLCQYWAERRRKLLVICPASLRKQWELELKEKFNLRSVVLDAKSYRNAHSNGNPNPFDTDALVICSFHYASRRASELQCIPWDLVVIDEAHKLRNAYRESNRMGQNLRRVLHDRRKILLTATPLQNSLLELFGLSTIIDENLFGDLPSFRTQYVNVGGDLEGLRERLQAFCSRTLRSQVLEYVKYTQRRLITRHFKPSDHEHNLYLAISSFLHREESYALPKRQRHLITLIVRKVLASSPRAVAGTLEIMRDRLRRIKSDFLEKAGIVDRIIRDEEIDDDLLDELLEDEEELGDLTNNHETVDETESPEIDPQRLDEEIEELDRFILWANSIGVDTKAKSLLSALEIGFSNMAEIGGSRKAVVFTESRRTQSYLKEFLESNGYAGKVLTFNGTNREPDTTEIYNRWLETNRNSGRISGSRPVDVRAAIIETFRDFSQVLLATEAAAEGINLQFCSLVVNFDLPWNPQRIEQRIGRCHRYGQKHDVVVINFLNQRNAADCRVHELLEEKFSLFSGIFGASDEVLGTIESGVDFERRILAIYQQCRTPEAIDAAFSVLQTELDEMIQSRLSDTRRILLENFDEDVHARLKVNLNGTRQQLDRVGRMFWDLTRFMLDTNAAFNDQELWFDLHHSPMPTANTGRYHLISKSKANIPGAFLYRLSHPLGEHVISTGARLSTPVAEVTFDISNHPTRIAMVEALKGGSGWLTLRSLCIDSFDREEYLLFSGFGDDGQPLDQEVCQRLFACEAFQAPTASPDQAVQERLDADAQRHVRATISRSLETNNRHFNEAREQLEKWADDMVVAAEKELDDIKSQIRATGRQARMAVTMQEQHAFQDQIRKLEGKKRSLRQRIFDVEDEIAEKRDRLIDALEQRMQQKTRIQTLFTIRWRVQ
jgi:superfamily II DNA or RNA helicase